MPKQGDRTCQNGGIRCEGYTAKHNCQGGTENELYTPGDFNLDVVGGLNQLYCKMPDDSIVCFEVTNVDTATAPKTFTLSIGCGSVPFSHTGCADNSDGLAISDVMFKAGNYNPGNENSWGSQYYSFEPGTSEGTFNTFNSKDLSHISICLEECPERRRLEEEHAFLRGPN